MTEETYQSLSVLLELLENWHGRWSLSIWITICTFQSFSKAWGKHNNLTSFWPIKALTSWSKETQTNFCQFYHSWSFPLRKRSRPRILRSFARHWKRFRSWFCQGKWSEKLWFLTTDRFFQCLTCLRTRDWTLGTRLTTHRERTRICQNWFKRLWRFWKSMEVKTHTST